MSSLLFKSALILVGVIALCGATRSASAHESHSAPPAAAPSGKQFETRFLKKMIDHHGMAVQMAKACSTRAEHEELRQLCEEMKTMQQQEIVQMQSWLQSWYGISHQPNMKKPEMAQMERLEALNGRAFEIAFMEMLTQHHGQAIRETEQCVSLAKHGELKDLCELMHKTQKSEVAKLNDWLCQWYQKCSSTSRSATSPAAVYTCPMHAEVVQDRPGACPKCGMALQKK